jgi:hypothetical protein
MEERAPRARACGERLRVIGAGVAELRPPSSLVVPIQDLEFTLVRPIFCATDVAVANRVVHYVIQFLGVRFRNDATDDLKIRAAKSEAGRDRPGFE